MGTREKERVIDSQGFRPNVGIIVASAEGQVLWGRRVGGRDSWQFPQGGMHAGESAEEAMSSSEMPIEAAADDEMEYVDDPQIDLLSA